MSIRRYRKLRRWYKHLSLPVAGNLTSDARSFVRKSSPEQVIARHSAELIAGLKGNELLFVEYDVPF
jgi:hypothetical protein